MEYSSEVVRRFAAQPGAPDLASEAPGLVTGEAEDRTLLVWVRFQLQVIDGVIQTVRYRVFGCPHTIANRRCDRGVCSNARAGARRTGKDELRDDHGSVVDT